MVTASLASAHVLSNFQLQFFFHCCLLTLDDANDANDDDDDEWKKNCLCNHSQLKIEVVNLCTAGYEEAMQWHIIHLMKLFGIHLTRTMRIANGSSAK